MCIVTNVWKHYECHCPNCDIICSIEEETFEPIEDDGSEKTVEYTCESCNMEFTVVKPD